LYDVSLFRNKINMRKHFESDKLEAWLEYYKNQAEQVGYGFSGFKGIPYQRGGGLGSFFRSLFRMAVPLLRSTATHVGKQALESGANIARDVAEGRPVNESFKDHTRRGVAKLAHTAAKKLGHNQSGAGLGIRPKAIKVVPNDIFLNNKKKQSKRKLEF
jgi:hypothetical protein